MSKFSKVLKVGVVAALVVAVAGGSVFAASDLSQDCLTKHPGIVKDANGDSSHKVKCTRIEGMSQYYGTTAADCAQLGSLASDPAQCGGNDLNSIVKMIINAVIFIIGIIAVIMVILGGVTYATSQGDSGKVKKGKDTILYGIIGLVVALLAFAIVNFVLGALQG